MRSGTASRRGCEIAIAHDDADGIRVEVTDDGIGMAADGTTEREPRATWPDRHARTRHGDGRFACRSGRAATGRGWRWSPACRALNARQSQHVGCAGMKILLVDDHVIVRSGLRNLLTSVSDTQISEAATGRDALLRLRQDRPDLVLLDLNLPGIGGLELLRRMLLEDKAARILVLSMHAEPLYAARAMELGARGYLSKNASAEELLTAVRRVAEGGRYIENEIAQELALQTVSPGHGLQDLTERDLEIMRLLAEGMSLAEIADALGIGYKTVANACSHIKAKLGVTRTNELVRLAMTLGIA